MSRLHKLFNGQRCRKCRTTEQLTRHHVKKDGKKTGRVQILCRTCHDKVEGTNRYCKECGTRLWDNEKDICIPCWEKPRSKDGSNM